MIAFREIEATNNERGQERRGFPDNIVDCNLYYNDEGKQRKLYLFSFKKSTSELSGGVSLNTRIITIAKRVSQNAWAFTLVL